MPCYYTGSPFGIVKINQNKAILSDGLLSEYLCQQGYFNKNVFQSIKSFSKIRTVKKNKLPCILLGNNYVEFGSMTAAKWELYISNIIKKYKNLYYLPHPREKKDKLTKLFGNKIITTDNNSEQFFITKGLPEVLLGDMCSTSLCTAALLNSGQSKIIGITNSSQYCDGPRRNIIDSLTISSKNVQVNFYNLINASKHILKTIAFQPIEVNV